MSLNAQSFVILFTNERDKMLKAFDARLLQFELKMQLLIEKQPKCGCLTREVNVSKILVHNFIVFFRL